MKKICLLVSLCLSLICHAQQFSPPNYATIKQKVNAPGSSLYYPKLVAKFQVADSSMTLVEKRHLYYGFVHQNKYSPYSRSDYVDSLNAVLKIKKMSRKDFSKLLNYSDSLLVDNPFNLNAYNYKSYAYSQLKEVALGEKIVAQKKIIIDAMMSSGDGLTKETPFYVISPNHQHFILKLLDLSYNGSQSAFDTIEFLSVDQNEQDITGIFFEVSAISEHMSKLFNDRP